MEGQEFFKGAIDYFDSLPPVEQSAYQDGFREFMENELQKEIHKKGHLSLLEQLLELPDEKEKNSDIIDGKMPMEILQAAVEKMRKTSKAS